LIFMPEDLEKSIKRVGIECESIENDSYGVARLTLNLLEQLAQRPELLSTHRFVLYFNGRIPQLPFLDNPLFEKKLIGLSKWKLPLSFSLYYYLLLPLHLWKDRLSAMYYPNYMLPIIHPPHVPSIVMMTDDIFQEAHNPKLPLRYRLAYQIFSTGWAKLRATRIMAISHASKAVLIQHGITDQRIVVNELGVRVALQPRREEEGVPYLLCVGQAFERRHVREVMEAFGRIAHQYPHLTLHIVGVDKYEPPIVERLAEKLNAQLGRKAVIWESRVTEERLHALYSGALATVYVSTTEAFGLPPLEGLSYGVAPIVGDTPVNREIYGEQAFYVKDQTVDGITPVLVRAIEDREARERIRESGPSILKRYTWAAHADRFLAMIQSLSS
jgi:glycosyltransferase involved in cell wall biosynthesis